jgi:hypothetical protein
MLNDCFINPSGLYLYPSGPSPSISWSSSLPLPLSGVFPAARRTGACAKVPPPLLPSISRYVRKLPETLLALHDFPSVHLLIPASRSSQTNTDPDLIDCLSFSDSRRCTRGNRPSRHASKSLIASAGVRTCPWYVSIMVMAVYGVQLLVFKGLNSNTSSWADKYSSIPALVSRAPRCSTLSAAGCNRRRLAVGRM